MDNPNKKYFAFISYSHRDIDWAKWIQHEFEYYILPDSLNKRTDLPRSFRPIFRDEDELAGGDLTPQIVKALKDSAYLIVICSPNAVESSYVNGEIGNFLKIGKDRNEDYSHKIFPLIVSGKPHVKDYESERECFPEALRTLTDFNGNKVELIAGDINATGRGQAFIKILAGILREKDIEFSQLWNRYEINKLEEEKKRKEERDRLYTMQSRFLAERAKSLSHENSYLARKIALYALPSDIQNHEDRPLVAEAEIVLRHSCKLQSGELADTQPSSLYFIDGRELVAGDKIINLQNGQTKDNIKEKSICVDVLSKSGYRIDYKIYDSKGNAYFSRRDKNEVIKWDSSLKAFLVLFQTTNIRKNVLKLAFDEKLLIYGSIDEVIILDIQNKEILFHKPSKCRNLIIDDNHKTAYWLELSLIRKLDLSNYVYDKFPIDMKIGNVESFTISSDNTLLAAHESNKKEFILFEIPSGKYYKHIQFENQLIAYRLDSELLSFITKDTNTYQITIFNVRTENIEFRHDETSKICQIAVDPSKGWVAWYTDNLKFKNFKTSSCLKLKQIPIKRDYPNIFDFTYVNNQLFLLGLKCNATWDKDGKEPIAINIYDFNTAPFIKVLIKDDNIALLSSKRLSTLIGTHMSTIDIDYYRLMSFDIAPNFKIAVTLYGTRLTIYDIDKNRRCVYDITKFGNIDKLEGEKFDQSKISFITDTFLVIVHRLGVSKWSILVDGQDIKLIVNDIVFFDGGIELSLRHSSSIVNPLVNQYLNEIYVLHGNFYFAKISTESLNIKRPLYDFSNYGNILYAELSPNGTHILCLGNLNKEIYTYGKDIYPCNSIFIIDTITMRVVDHNVFETEFIVAHFNEDGNEILIFNIDGELLSYPFPSLQDLINQERLRFENVPLTELEKQRFYIL